MTKDKLREKLLALPDPYKEEIEGLDYEHCGFGPADADGVLELAIEEEQRVRGEDPDAISNLLIHAWRVIASAAGERLFKEIMSYCRIEAAFDRDEFVEEFPLLMTLVGGPAVDPLVQLLHRWDDYADMRIHAAWALAALAAEGVGKTEVQAALAACLELTPADRMVNGSVIASLIELQAVSCLPAIKASFDRNEVDLSIGGDFEEVERALGVRKERSKPAENWGTLEAKLRAEKRLEELGEKPSADDPDALIEYYLGLRGGDDSAEDVETVDGLILASLLAPVMIFPSVYTDLIWDYYGRGFKPRWADTEEAGEFFRAILEWHNSVIETLEKDCYRPVLGSLKDDEFQAESWGMGILLGCTLWGEQDEEGSKTLHGVTDRVLEIGRLEDRKEDRDPAKIQQAVDSLVEYVSHVFHERKRGRKSSSSAGMQPGAAADAEDKPGRNDPCPCGSGRKYKRCCMN